MTDYTHIPSGNDLKENGLPKNTISVKLNLCADARSKNCPYSIDIKIDTDWVAFKQTFCAYEWKKK
jgi:hypothetical protein